MSENRPQFDVFSAAGENFRPRGAPKLVFLLFFCFHNVQNRSETVQKPKFFRLRRAGLNKKAPPVFQKRN